jgi:hypothetical protein
MGGGVSRAFEDAFNLLCDRQVGNGMSRKVFTSVLLPECVIKVEDDAHRFQNVVEWETWNRIKYTPASRWFAECKWISPNGIVLIMERTLPPRAEDFPKRMPVFLSDFKRTNYGMAKSKGKKQWLVCHDYGTHLLWQEGCHTKRTKNADWWDE